MKLYRGLYANHQGWTSSNWSRVVNAHKNLHADFTTIDTYFAGTFNLVTTGQAEGDFAPYNDDSDRDSANATGVANGSEYSTGADFLTKGNYVLPYDWVYFITRVSDSKQVELDPPGRLYYPGSPNSYNPTRDAVNRNILHIIAPFDLTDPTRFGSVSPGEEFTIEVDGSETLMWLELLSLDQFEKLTVPQTEYMRDVSP